MEAEGAQPRPGPQSVGTPGRAGFYRRAVRDHETQRRAGSVFACCDEAHRWAHTARSWVACRGAPGAGADRPGFESGLAISRREAWESPVASLSLSFHAGVSVGGAAGGRAGAGLPGPCTHAGGVFALGAAGLPRGL